jgi:hypothetical protein
MRAPDRFRFRPPSLTLDRETRWCVLRAFGPADRPAEPETLNHSQVFRVAGLLSVGARIAARTPLAVLQAELGPDAARQLLITQAYTQAMTTRLLGVAREVGICLESLGERGALLKGTALVATGAVAAASRPISDLDLLVTRETVPELQCILIERGFTASDVPPQEQHASPLSRGSSMVELHTSLLGIRLGPGGPWADLPALEAAGHLAPLDDWPASIVVPDRDIMLAHILAHGLAQHGLTPDKYPLARMLQDLIDLGFQHLGEGDLERIGAMIAADVSIRELRATRGLCAALVSADLIAPAQDSGDVWLLLCHVIAGALDEKYTKALRLRSMVEFPVSGGRSVIRRVAQTICLTRGQVDAIYGRQRSWLGYALLRLWRPFDLVRRSVLYAWHAHAHRRTL